MPSDGQEKVESWGWGMTVWDCLTSWHWGTVMMKGFMISLQRLILVPSFYYLFGWEAHYALLFALGSFWTWAKGSHLACIFG